MNDRFVEVQNPVVLVASECVAVKRCAAAAKNASQRVQLSEFQTRGRIWLTLRN